LLLLHESEGVSSDRLIDQLWDAEPPGSGVAALRVRVSQLRKALGRAGDRLETNPAGYLLRVGSGELDLDRFTRLWGKPTARSRPWLPRGSARRSRSGGARRGPISHTQALPSSRSPASRSCGWWRSSGGSRPTSSSAGTASSSAS